MLRESPCTGPRRPAPSPRGSRCLDRSWASSPSRRCGASRDPEKALHPHRVAEVLVQAGQGDGPEHDLVRTLEPVPGHDRRRDLGPRSLTDDRHDLTVDRWDVEVGAAPGRNVVVTLQQHRRLGLRDVPGSELRGQLVGPVHPYRLGWETSELRLAPKMTVDITTMGPDRPRVRTVPTPGAANSGGRGQWTTRRGRAPGWPRRHPEPSNRTRCLASGSKA